MWVPHSVVPATKRAKAAAFWGGNGGEVMMQGNPLGASPCPTERAEPVACHEMEAPNTEKL